MNICYVYADGIREWNSSNWRCDIPYRCIRELDGHGAAMITIDDFVHSVEEYAPQMRMVAASDLIFFQRNMCFEDVYRVAQYWRGVGKPVVVDLDDDYLGLPAGNSAYNFWYDEDGKKIKAMARYLKEMDAVTSPNKLILEKWRKAGVERTLWVPNYAYGKWFQNLQKTAHDGFWVGWGGSHSHYDTWFRSGCAEGLAMACAERPDIKVVIMGSDRRILEMIPAPAEQKIYGGKVVPITIGPNGEQINNLHLWPRALAQFDVSLAPLGGQYDQHRSWIHALEPMLAKVPFICSHGAPYAELGQWGCVILDDKPESWRDAIINARDNYDGWRNRAEDAYKQALQYTMEARARDYIEKLWALKRKRMAALGARLPGVVYVRTRATA